MVDATTQSNPTQYLPSSYLDDSGNLKGGISQEKAAEVSQGIQARVSTMSQAEKVIFLALIKSPDFAPSASTSIADTEKALGNLEAAAEKLSLTTNSNTAKLLGRILVEIGAQQRQEALDSRLNARSAARAELEAGANKLRDASQETRDGGRQALITGAVMGGVSMAAAGAGGYTGSKAIDGATKAAGSATSAAAKTAETAVDAASDAAATAAKASAAAAKTTTPAVAKGIDAAGDTANVVAKTPQGAIANTGTAAAKATDKIDDATLGAKDAAAKIASKTDDVANEGADTAAEALFKLEQASKVNAAKAGGYNAAAGSITAIGGAVTGKVNADASANAQLDQADQSELQAEAEVTKSEGELEASEQQALQEFVNQLIQFIKEMRDAEVEQMAVVTRG